MKKVIINENQYNKLLISEELFSTKSFKDILETFCILMGCGLMTLSSILMCIDGNKNIPEEEKEILKDEVQKEAQKINTTKVDIITDTVPLVKTRINDASNDEWRCISFHGIVTVYNSVEAQCNADFQHTASGFKLDLKHPEKHRIVAMDREFMKYHGIHFGDIIKIEGTHNGKEDGIYQVQDYMNKRFKMMPKVDVLTDNTTKYGGSISDNAKIYVLKKRGNRDRYLQTMKQAVK